jgi:hypothetical protein
VLSAGAGAEEVEHFSEVHRTALERSAGVVVSRRAWEHGFRLALYDLLVNRLSMYALIGRFRSQPYLPRVVRTWKTLYDLFPYAGLEAA